MPMFISKATIPRVRNMKGRNRNFRMPPNTELMAVKITLTSSSWMIVPWKWKPGMKPEAAYIPRALIAMRRISLITEKLV